MSHVQENLARFYSKLEVLRKEEKFVDITLQCESRSFKCHQLALILASPYFETMFESGFMESTSKIIVLQEVDAAVFEEVLHFMYTGDVNVNTTNVCDLLRMSDYFSLPGIEDLCLKFVSMKHQMTIQNLLHMFMYTCHTEKNDFVSILSSLIAENFSICCKLEEFLEVPFAHLQNILRQCLLLPSRNEELLLSTIIQWTSYKRGERLNYLHKLFGMIQFESISSGYFKLVTEMLIKEQDPVSVLSKPVDCDIVPELLNDRVLKVENGLHVYVRYEEERLIQIFSINNSNECINSAEISVTDPDINFRCAVSDDLYLYCLNFGHRDPMECNREKQIFCAYTSVDGRVTISLAPPPLLLHRIALCYLQNNIYAYDEEAMRYPVVRTNSTSGEMFNDEEITRGIFVYNCSSDNWFPVPQMKKLLWYSCMTVCENSLYLIGGSELYSQLPSEPYAQAFDFRVGWRILPASYNKYMGANCCSLNGKIYVCGSAFDDRKNAERYDPIAGKWELIESMDNEATFHRMIPFNNKLWVMGSYSYNETEQTYQPSNDLSMNVYDIAMNQWSKSSILKEAVTGLFLEPGNITETVVFSIL